MKHLKIGNIELENRYILGPMAGVTDLPFRLLCREQGAGLLCMEMISAKAIYYNNRNTESLLEIHPDERPVSLQLFGSDPQIMSEMAKRIEERPFAILDVNMGCPVPKVVKNGEGSALMKEPKLVYEIVSALVKAIKKPVTVKIRKGFDDEHVNAVEIAKIIEGGRRVGRGGPRTDERAVLQREGGLGHYPAGERGDINSCHRKRRCDVAAESGRTGAADRMRRHYDRTRRGRQPVDLLGDDRV